MGDLFGEDTVLDWFAELEASSDDEVPGLLGAALQGTGEVAVAAAVLVAHGCARAVRTGQPVIDVWLAGHRPWVDRRLADEALAVLDRHPALVARLSADTPASAVRAALVAGPSRHVV